MEGGDEAGVGVLGYSMSMARQTRNLVTRQVEEHLSLTATENDPVRNPEDLQNRIGMIRNGISEEGSRFHGIIVATESWSLPEFLKEIDNWILLKTSFYSQNGRVRLDEVEAHDTVKASHVQIYIAERQQLSQLLEQNVLLSNNILLMDQEGSDRYWEFDQLELHVL